MDDALKEKIEAIRSYNGPPLRLMEVCGTHTMQMYRTGIRQLLPSAIKVVSGPGCPVCVTPAAYVDQALAMAREYDVTILTYGDMIRVPGSSGSLERARSEGMAVKTVLSALDAVKIAAGDQAGRYIFLAVGFETTTPATALAVKHAAESGVENLRFLLAHKTMPPALEYLTKLQSRVDAFLYPGHVAAITGMGPFAALVQNGVSGVVAGFEAEDLVEAIHTILCRVQEGEAFCANAYESVVSDEGNIPAQKLVSRIFEPCDAVWRGLGTLPDSGLRFREEYRIFDADGAYPCQVQGEEPPGCMCGKVLSGEIEPRQCGLFGHACNPRQPVGACMVSSEGSCAAAFRYGMGAEV